MTQINYEIRRYADGSFGLGENIIPGVTLFRAGNYGLDKEGLDQAIKRTKQGGSNGESGHKPNSKHHKSHKKHSRS